MNNLLYTLLLLLISSSAMAQDQKQEEVMTKSKGTYVVNTKSICDARGFKGPTPVKVTIKKNKIEKVEHLQNMETPKFFGRVVELLLPKFSGISIDDHEQVDAVSGATISSNAVKANVKAAVEYYKKNK